MVDRIIEEDEMELAEILRPIRRRWRLVSAIIAISAVATYVWTLTLPKIYQSSVSILPPTALGALNGGGGAPSLSALAAIPGLGASMGVRNVSDLFAVILKSRQMTDNVIDKFDLMRVYDQKYREKAEKRLAAATKVVVSREGLISVFVEDTVPQRAAEIANYYAANLDAINRKIQVEMSRQRRTFFKEQSQSMTRNLGDVDAELGTRLGSLSRDMGVGQQVIVALLQQYQQAKIEEARNFPLVQVLDPAVPAEFPVKPSKRTNVAIAVVLSGMLAAALAIYLDRRAGTSSTKM